MFEKLKKMYFTLYRLFWFIARTFVKFLGKTYSEQNNLESAYSSPYFGTVQV